MHEWDPDGKSSDKLTSHMGELFATALKVVAVLGLDSVLDCTGYRVVDTEDRALNKLNLPRGITSEVALLGSLSLAPGFGGRGLTAGIGRRNASRHPKAGSRILHLILRVLSHSWSVCRVGFGQTVLRRGTYGRVSALLGVVKGATVGTLVE